MRIFVKSIIGDTTRSLDVEPTDTIEQVRAKVQELDGGNEQDWMLDFGGNRSVKADIIRQLSVLAGVERPGTEIQTKFVMDAAKELLGHLETMMESGIPVANVDVEMEGTRPGCSYWQEDAVEEMEVDQQGKAWSFEQMEKLVKFVDDHPTLGFKTIKNRFKRLTNRTQLWRMKKVVAKGGSTAQKWAYVEKAVLEKFETARTEHLPVHDITLRGWAREAADEAGFEIAACPAWATNFKAKHGISSRKVTEVVSRIKVENATVIAESAAQFRTLLLEEVKNFEPERIFNTDQSPFKYEYYTGRTLSHKGEEITRIKAKSVNKAKHSYTVQPMLDYNGKLRGKLFVCLQETGGKMGPVVEHTYFRARNIEVTCSKSGLLETDLFKYWVEQCLHPEAGGDCLLVLDSWGGQKNDDCFTLFEEIGPACKRLTIPPNSTGTTQPLDVFYNQQWKQVVKKLYEYVVLNRIDVDMYQRDNILKMQSLVHNQFSSDQFVPMGLLAWHQAGLMIGPVPRFEGVNDILFPIDLDRCIGCDGRAFIRCSHCRERLCFEHFFRAYHTHF